MKQRKERFQELEYQRLCSKIVPPCDVRSYTHKVLPTRMSKHELNKGNSNGHAKVDTEKPTMPKTYREGQATKKCCELLREPALCRLGTEEEVWSPRNCWADAQTHLPEGQSLVLHFVFLFLLFILCSALLSCCFPSFSHCFSPTSSLMFSF